MEWEWLKKYYAIIALLLLTIGLIVAVFPLFLSSAILPGGDNATHITTIGRLVKIIQNSGSWWTPDYYAGFPLELYYQPLPHTVTAIAALLLGGAEKTILAYNIMLLLLLIAFPWSIYYSLRILGSERLSALLAAIIAISIHHYTFHGSQPSIFGNFAGPTQAILQTGLYTQAWGNVLFPLAFSTLYLAIKGDRTKITWAIITIVLLSLSHLFYALALAFLSIFTPLIQCRWPYGKISLTGAIAFTLCFLVNASYFAPAYPEIAIGFIVFVYLLLIPELWRNYLRLLVIGGVVLATLLFWLLPLYQSMDFMGGYPLEKENIFGGLGMTNIIKAWGQGSLFDAGKNPQVLTLLFTDGIEKAYSVAMKSAGIPFYSLLIIAGLISCGYNLAKNSTHRYILLAFLLFLCALAGRKSFGPLINIYRPHWQLPLYRYCALLDIIGSMLAGIFAGSMISYLQTKKITRAIAVLVCIYLVASLGLSLLFIHQQSRPLDMFLAATAKKPKDLHIYHDFQELKSHLQKIPGLERLMLPSKTSSWHNILAYYSGRPCSGGLGVGGHDSLNFYYLEKTLAYPAYWEKLSIVYNLRYLLLREPLPKYWNLKLIWQSSHKIYYLYQFQPRDFRQNANGYFAVINTIACRKGSPRENDVRLDTLYWLKGNGPLLSIHPQLTIKPNRQGNGFYEIPQDQLLYVKNYPITGVAVVNKMQHLHNRDGFYVFRQSHPAKLTFYIPAELTNFSLWSLLATDIHSRTAIRQVASLDSQKKTVSFQLPDGSFELVVKPLIPGNVVSENIDFNQGTYSAEIEMDLPGCLLFKMTYHPFWSVSVDGIPQEKLFVYPAFMGVRVGKGHHKVSFRCRRPGYSYVLLAIAWLPLAIWIIWCRQQNRRNRLSHLSCEKKATTTDKATE